MKNNDLLNVENQINLFPQTKNKLLDVYYPYAVNVLAKLFKKHNFFYWNIDFQDIPSLAYIYLITTWKRFKVDKYDNNFKTYLNVSLKYSFLTYLKSCRCNPEDIPKLKQYSIYNTNYNVEEIQELSDFQKYDLLSTYLKNCNRPIDKKIIKLLMRDVNVNMIAQKLNISVSKVYYVINRIKTKLKKEICIS